MTARTVEELVLVHHPDFDPNAGFIATTSGSIALPTAVGDPDAYVFRVAVTARQAIVGFPKFGTIGVGFETENDWNTNLPYSSGVDRLLDHIGDNRTAAGDEAVPRDVCAAAVRLMRDGCAALPGYGQECSRCQSPVLAAARATNAPWPPPMPEHVFTHWEDDPACPSPPGYFDKLYGDRVRGDDGWLLPEPDEDDEDDEVDG